MARLGNRRLSRFKLNRSALIWNALREHFKRLSTVSWNGGNGRLAHACRTIRRSSPVGTRGRVGGRITRGEGSSVRGFPRPVVSWAGMESSEDAVTAVSEKGQARDVDDDQIAERLSWTPRERLQYLLDMLAFEERARSARPVPQNR